MIGIIGAMKIEIEKIQSIMTEKKEKRIAGISFVSGKIHGKNVVTAICGIGKVAAATCAQAMILEYSPDCIINTGAAGSLSPKLNIGDIVIANTLVQHDMDTTALGDAYGYISGLNIVDIPTDSKICELMKKAAETEEKYAVYTGKIASGDQFVANNERKDFIVKTFGAIACEMEGAAIAQTCFSNGVKFSVLRAISDCADGSSHMDYSCFLPLAANNSAKIIENFVKLY